VQQPVEYVGVREIPVGFRQYHRAAARARVHQALGGEHLDGLADDRAAETQCRYEVIFRRKCDAGAEVPARDLLPQVGHHLVREIGVPAAPVHAGSISYYHMILKRRATASPAGRTLGKPDDQPSSGTISSATMLMILISGLIAGPAVSL
jgi:hypothetical protein